MTFWGVVRNKYMQFFLRGVDVPPDGVSGPLVIFLQVLVEWQEVLDHGFAAQLRVPGDLSHGQLPMHRGSFFHHVAQQPSSLLTSGAVVTQVQRLSINHIWIVFTRILKHDKKGGQINTVLTSKMVYMLAALVKFTVTNKTKKNTRVFYLQGREGGHGDILVGGKEGEKCGVVLAVLVKFTVINKKANYFDLGDGIVYSRWA